MSDHQSDHQDRIKTLGKELKGIRIAMMTTAEPDGTLRSRPMAMQDMEFDGDLWFFTGAASPKVDEVERDQRVNLSYVKDDDKRYVSVSGTARLVRDRQKIHDLWKPLLKAWFPKGEDDPDLALLKVEVTEAEYWDAPSSAMVRLGQVAGALVTGQRDSGGKNEKLDLA